MLAALTLSVGAALAVSGCKKTEGVKSTSNKIAQPYLGHWVTFATNGAPVTLTMTLEADGKFRGKTIEEKKTTAFSGHFRTATEDFASGPATVIFLAYDEVEGMKLTAADKAREKRFLYDAQDDVLTDILTTGFCRPGQEAKMRVRFK